MAERKLPQVLSSWGQQLNPEQAATLNDFYTRFTSDDSVLPGSVVIVPDDKFRNTRGSSLQGGNTGRIKTDWAYTVLATQPNDTARTYISDKIFRIPPKERDQYLAHEVAHIALQKSGGRYDSEDAAWAKSKDMLKNMPVLKGVMDALSGAQPAPDAEAVLKGQK